MRSRNAENRVGVFEQWRPLEPRSFLKRRNKDEQDEAEVDEKQVKSPLASESPLVSLLKTRNCQCTLLFFWRVLFAFVLLRQIFKWSASRDY